MSFRPYPADTYIDYPALLSWCEALCAAMPDWFSLDEIGQSRQGRPILLITVGERSGGADPGQKPAVWLDGGTHASEWAGVMATLYTLSCWAEQIASGDRRFSDSTAYVLPCMSPDGFQAIHEGSPLIRSSLRPPMPGASHRIGLEPQDVDGDGEVLWMRWRHPAGPFVDRGDGLLRRRTLSDDPADAYVVCAEGLFLSWDGHAWRQAPLRHGQDLNRNFPAHWEPFGMFGMDAGPYPISEPESRAATDALAARLNIAVGISNHTYTGALLTQPYRADSPLSAQDIRLMERLAQDVVEGTGYAVHRVHPDFTYDPKRPIVGVWSDSLATVFGLPGYTLELWNPFAWAGVSVEQPAEFFRNPDPDVVAAILEKARAEPGGWVDWRSFSHPQLGPIEIGGLRHLMTVRNPPPAELRAECQRAFTVIERCRLALPRLEVSTQVDRHGDLSEVTVVIDNVGYLPTSALQRGAAVAQAAPVVASLQTGKGVSLQRGPESHSLGHIEGWGSDQVGPASTPIYPGLSAEGPRRIARWWVQGTGEVSIRWAGGRAGSGLVTISV